MTTITLGFGKANYPAASVSFASLRVKAPFIKDSASNTGRKLPGSRQFIAAGRLQHHSGFSNERVEHPTHTVLLAQGTRFRNGLKIADGAIMFRMREGAPLIQIYGKVPPSPENTCGEHILLFSGNADIITPDEAASYDISVPPSYQRNYMDRSEVAELFHIVTVTQGTIARPTPQVVQTEDGPVVREIPAMPVRRLRIRR